jgi:uncharacterized membrane protein
LPWPGLCCLRIHRQEIHQLRSTQALRCQDVLQGATFLRDCGLVPGQVKLVKMLYIMIYIYIDIYWYTYIYNYVYIIYNWLKCWK